MTLRGLIEAVHEWSGRKLDDYRLERFGGIQQCPWCRQTANQGEHWTFHAWDRDPMLDVLTCGVCGGTSLWRFELGMMWIGPLEPPKPAYTAVAYYDIDRAILRAMEAEGCK